MAPRERRVKEARMRRAQSHPSGRHARSVRMPRAAPCGRHHTRRTFRRMPLRWRRGGNDVGQYKADPAVCGHDATVERNGSEHTTRSWRGTHPRTRRDCGGTQPAASARGGVARRVADLRSAAGGADRAAHRASRTGLLTGPRGPALRTGPRQGQASPTASAEGPLADPVVGRRTRSLAGGLSRDGARAEPPRPQRGRAPRARAAPWRSAPCDRRS